MKMNRRLLTLGGVVAVVLIVFAGAYGYHRDELYFLAAGRHLAWAYDDQGPFTPLVARAMGGIAPDSLTVLRIPSAIAAGLVVVLTGLIARELGGSRRAELLAAACAAVAPVVLFTGHLLSTSTFDLLAWTAVTWLAVRAVRTQDGRLWLGAGLILGLALLNKPLPAFLALGLLAGVVLVGPRGLLRSPWVWGGAALALLLFSPWVIWQAGHGWPQIDVSRSIAAGNSTSSQPWWAILPFQLLLAGPPLAPVWIAGLVWLWRNPAARRYRFIAVAWGVLAVIFMATGGKPYYLAGLLPVLLAAGSVATDRWMRGRTGRGRAVRAAVAVTGLVSAVISLPVLPARDAGVVVNTNPDVGETIGWPDLVRTVDGVYRHAGSSPQAVILGSNYGEAGAVDRYGPALGLPQAYGVQNAYWRWGPPPARGAPVITIGFSRPFAALHFAGCRQAARIHDAAGIENDEDGEPVLVCAHPVGGWAEQWPKLRRLG
jgi:dolichyl-phosphate-mannose-protein mannosyltransferase